MDASTIVPVFIIIVVVLVVFSLIRAVYNYSQPRLRVEAIVSGKRSSDADSSSFYYATFEFTTGDRKEFLVSSSEYRRLRKYEKGMLTFQGNRFISFERIPS